MNTAIEQIKQRIDIVDFISSYIPIKRAGRNFKANCPFHQEKTPSFIISPDRQIWHCFGACQTGGDVISFLMKWENITFYEALKDLAKKTGISIKHLDFSDETWKKRNFIFSINKKASDFYQYILKQHEIGAKAREYLFNRSITDAIISAFALGYAPSSWNSLTNYLVKKNVPLDQAVEAGLIIKSSSGRFFDRFHKRIMFPLSDHRGNIVGFSGRTIDPNEKDAKYINTPETCLYHKREILYGFHLTKENIKKENKAIVAEGEFDMISLYQNGFNTAVSIKGSALTKDQLMLLKRYTNKLILALDSDIAGEETIKRTLLNAEPLDFEISVAYIDWAKDPDEAFKKDPAKYKKILKNPIPIYDYIITSTLKKYPEKDNAYTLKRIGDEIVPYLALIKNPIVKTFYVKKLASLIDLTPQTVEERLIQYRKKSFRVLYSVPESEKKQESRYELLQKYLLYLLILDKEPKKLIKNISELFYPDDFSSLALSKLFIYLTQNLDSFAYEENISSRIKIIASNLPKELLPVFDKVILFYHEDLKEKIRSEEFIKLLYECKRYSLKNKIDSLVKEEKNKSFNEPHKNLLGLQKQLSEVEKKLSLL